MLVKLNPDDDMVEKLKHFTGQRVASKAYELAGKEYPDMIQRIYALEVQLQDLEEIILVQQSIIDGARDAAALLVERTSQKDLFVG